MNRTRTKLNWWPAAGATLFALLVAGSGAHAGAVFHMAGSNTGGLAQTEQDLGSLDNDPDNYNIITEDAKEGTDPVRAHSDVPDLPDLVDDPPPGDASGDSDPDASSGGGNYFESPDLPDLGDILIDFEPLRPFGRAPTGIAGYSGGSSTVHPGSSSLAVPAPGSAFVLGVVGLGLASRRRRS